MSGFPTGHFWDRKHGGGNVLEVITGTWRSICMLRLQTVWKGRSKVKSNVHRLKKLELIVLVVANYGQLDKRTNKNRWQLFLIIYSNSITDKSYWLQLMKETVLPKSVNTVKFYHRNEKCKWVTMKRRRKQCMTRSYSRKSLWFTVPLIIVFLGRQMGTGSSTWNKSFHPIL